MKNTYITYVPSTKEFKKDELVNNMKLLDVKNTVGFTTPDFYLFFECEENKHYYNIPSFERNFTVDDSIEEVAVVDKLIIVVSHKGEFTELVNDIDFVNDLYAVIETRVPFKNKNYTFDTILSANV